jgi:hypothetical protein
VRRSVGLLAAAVYALPLSAEQVILKNGGRVSGVLLERSATRVVLQIGPGTMALPMSSVERIVEGISPLATFQDRAARLSPIDRDGWTELGVWARDQGLETQARDCFSRALALDPRNPIAQAGVGNVLVDGRWLTQDDAYRVKGYVRYEGAWMYPEEREAMIREREERRADLRAEADRRARVEEAEAQARAAEAAARAQQASGDYGYGIPLGYAYGGYSYGAGYGYARGGPYGRGQHVNGGVGYASMDLGVPQSAYLTTRPAPPPPPPMSSWGLPHAPVVPTPHARRPH